MKIIFLCGTLEPGKDGVGDYTRRLAGEIIRQGNEVVLIAINDRYVCDSNFSEHINSIESAKLTEIHKELASIHHDKQYVQYCTQNVDGVSIFIIRISFLYPWKLRKIIIQNVIKQFSPDWVSLQFVPYSFNSKGLPFKLIVMLYTLRKLSVNWHVMFHEFRIGINRFSNFKAKVVGFFQLVLIKLMLFIIKPLKLHTSNDYYLALLSNNDIKCNLAPIFGNFNLERDDSFILDKAIELQYTLPFNWKNPIRLVCFGSIHADFRFDLFLQDAERLFVRTQRPIMMISIGQQGESGKHLWEKWVRRAEETNFLRLYALGAMEPKVIRSVFASSDAGISLSFHEVWGKSGAIAAMVESGLRVYGYLGNVSPKDVNWALGDLDAIKLINGWEDNFVTGIPKVTHSLLSYVADIYLESFSHT